MKVVKFRLQLFYPQEKEPSIHSSHKRLEWTPELFGSRGQVSAPLTAPWPTSADRKLLRHIKLLWSACPSSWFFLAFGAPHVIFFAVPRWWGLLKKPESQEISPLYEGQGFITVRTKPCHRSHSLQLQHTSLPYNLCLHLSSKWTIPSDFPIKGLKMYYLFYTHVLHSHPTFLSLFNHPNCIRWTVLCK